MSGNGSPGSAVVADPGLAAVGLVEHVDADGVVTYAPAPIIATDPLAAAVSAATAAPVVVKPPTPITDQVLAETEGSLRKKARVALKSGYLPTTMYTEEQVMMIVRAGEELGLPFVTSLRTIGLVEGKITLEAALMRALALRKVRGSRIIFRENSAERCVIEMSRPSAAIVAEYTIEHARTAKLLTKTVWQRNPISMLIARASAIGCRAIFGDALIGGAVYDPEELESVDTSLDDADVAAETDTEVWRLRGEIEAAAVSLPPDKREACLAQTSAATLGKNLSLLRKIKERVQSLLGATPPVEEPTSRGQEGHAAVQPQPGPTVGEAAVAEVGSSTQKKNEEITP